MNVEKYIIKKKSGFRHYPPAVDNSIQKVHKIYPHVINSLWINDELILRCSV